MPAENLYEIPESVQENNDEYLVTKRFVSYVQINTQSNEYTTYFPSTPGQLELGKIVRDELESIGMQNIVLDKNGYLTAELPSNTSRKVPVIGFLAHFDTSPEVSGDSVVPVFHENYAGGDLVLDKENQFRITGDYAEYLPFYKGQTIISSNGHTLLGADDKAGVAEIVTAMQHLIEHPEIEHGKILVCFTPDEEIGRGVDKIDLERFNPNFAYTMDGGGTGTIEYENFNAAVANLVVTGVNVHPGYAKNKMINAIMLAKEIDNLIPREERPEYTEKYQGYFHLTSFSGTVELVEMQYIIRDFDKDSFHKRKLLIQQVVDSLQTKYPNAEINIEMKDQYYNMAEKIKPVMHIVDLAIEAFRKCGLEPIIMPIRGGTDGSRLSYLGIPCPNIFAGGHNFHSRYEYVSTRSLLKATEIIVNIATLNAVGTKPQEPATTTK